MKFNLYKIMFVVFGIIYIAFFTWFLYGCKEPKVIYKTEYKTIRDTLIVNGDTIIRDIYVKENCPECKPKTRLETRLEYKLDKKALQNALKEMKRKYKYKIDSLGEIISVQKVQLTENRKIINKATKWNVKETVNTKVNPWRWFLIGLIVGVVLFFILKFVSR